MNAAIPPLLSVRVAGEILGLSPATTYRTIAKTLPRAAMPGKHRILTADVEKLIGREITADEYVRAVAKARPTNATRAPGNSDTANLQALSDGTPEAA